MGPPTSYFPVLFYFQRRKEKERKTAGGAEGENK
jgi:hypothetical protein